MKRSSLPPLKRSNLRFVKRKKYNNSSCSCLQGHLHDSRGEAGYCNDLEILRKTKNIKSYEIQRSYDLTVNGKTICKHIVDFVITNNEGREEVHEFKGFATAVWNLKRKLFEAVYPDIKYIVIYAK